MRPTVIPTSSWYAMTRRGLVASAFSVISLVRPGRSLRSAVALCVAFAVLDGIIAVASAARALLEGKRRLDLAVEGAAGVSALILIGFYPDVRPSFLFWVVAAWATIAGLTSIVRTVFLGRPVRSESLLAPAGICVMRFGVVLVEAACSGALDIALCAATNACVFIIALSLAAFAMRAPRTTLGTTGFARLRRL
jgi:uncharacterized membrane protein HdeD (DUF308 family)